MTSSKSKELSLAKRQRIARSVAAAHALGPTYTSMRGHTGRNTYTKRNVPSGFAAPLVQKTTVLLRGGVWDVKELRKMLAKLP